MRKPGKNIIALVSVATAIAVVPARVLTQQNAPPKTDQEKCLTDKDHEACKKYYRLQCVNKNADACGNYSKELQKDCGAEPGPQTSREQLSAYLACRRTAQCWQDRSFAIAAMNRECSPDTNSPQCKAARDRFANVTAQSCDNPRPSVF